ncbi:hypothetical protein [Absidia glauca]|uniref:Protein Zds1 C-terminal domain-containing protein n=1 Tax=Absidia glauca TaxID=4829 RepID=A0A168S170_ABSGL|nr:hypothetical protein [Absidia glauca]
MSHTHPNSIDSDQCTLTHTYSQETLSTHCNAPTSSSPSLPSPPSTPSTSSSISHTSQQPNSNPSIDVEQEQDNVPFAAAGLTRAVETNHGLSLTEILNISTTNPSHLFWVPASQHPELAPTEFEKYVTALRAHTKDKGKVKRRRSVLSVSFTADDDDNDNTTSKNDDDDYDDSYSRDHERQSALEDLEKEHLGSTSLSLDDNGDHHPISRNRSSDNTNSNQDHDKDVSKARKERLRRSRSLHLPDNKGDRLMKRRIPEFLVFDRNSTALDQSPVLVPKTDRPLSRRGARTRFQRTSSIAPSSMGSSDSTCPTQQHQWPHHMHSDSLSSSPTTCTTSSTKSTDTTATTATQEQSDPTYQQCSLSDDSPTSDDSQLGLQTLLSTITKELQQDHLQQYQQQRDIVVESPKDGSNESHDQALTFSTTSPTSLSQPLIPKPSTRERKSSWSWSSLWSDDKKAKAEQPPANLPLSSTNALPSLTTSSSTPTSSSVSKHKFAFASLFSRKPSSSSTSTTEEKATHSTMSPPKHFALNKINHQHRLPIHIERGVYRLSHVKLANPRRPLHDQVIISNFMFWYLSIANQHHPVDNPTPHIPPRAPQHAVASSKQKKKRLTRKSERQQPKQHPSSMYIQRPCNSPSSQAPWQKSTDISAHHQEQQQQSTGFVIPNDYLHPTHRKKPSKSPRARPSSTSSGSSSSSSSEEDDDNDTSLYSHTPPKHPSQHDISLQSGAPTLITTKSPILPLR